MILNLDTEFDTYPSVESVKFEEFTFSGGEPHIKILSSINPIKKVMVTHRIKSFNDFGLLIIAIDALKRMEVRDIEVLIPYFPAARQDRVMVQGESLSLKVYADLLNTFCLNSVTVFDPHSEVTAALINNCKVVSNHNFIKKTIDRINENLILVAPDGGALKKIYKLSVALGGVAVVECSKLRDVKTGKLSGFKVYEEDLTGKNCLVVDDICDGGGTFIGLAEELKKKNANKLFLAVSHGIFSKGFSELTKHYEKVFCTDSFNSLSGNKEVVQIKLKDLLTDE